MKKIILLLVSVFFWQFLPVAKTAKAQGVFDLSLTPSTAYLKVKPGNTAYHTITLENTGSNPIVIKPEFSDFVPNNGSAVPQETFSFPYFEIPDGGFPAVKLQPKQKSQLTLKINPSTTSKQQEYHLTVFFRLVNDQKQTGSSVAGLVGSNLIILVAKEPILSSLKLDQFGIGGVIDSFRPINFQPKVNNPSIQAIVASGSASLKNWQGNTLYQAEIYPDTVLGQETRVLRAKGKTVFDPTTTQSTIQPESFVCTQPVFLGLYKLEIELYDSQNQKQTYAKMIVALPLSLVMISLATTLCLLVWHLIGLNLNISLLQKSKKGA